MIRRSIASSASENQDGTKQSMELEILTLQYGF